MSAENKERRFFSGNTKKPKRDGLKSLFFVQLKKHVFKKQLTEQMEISFNISMFFCQGRI